MAIRYRELVKGSRPFIWIQRNDGTYFCGHCGGPMLPYPLTETNRPYGCYGICNTMCHDRCAAPSKPETLCHNYNEE